jgi:hypothetical protein
MGDGMGKFFVASGAAFRLALALHLDSSTPP